MSTPTLPNGDVLHSLDVKWAVPTDYFALYRTWHGRVHRDFAWTCFEEEQSLVIGPARRGSQHLTGTPCLFRAQCSTHNGYYSWVMSRWGRDECIPTHRLVPIELCMPIRNLNQQVFATMNLTKPIQKMSSSFIDDLTSGRVTWRSLVLERRALRSSRKTGWSNSSSSSDR
jgi:hypothetical protein